jgi:CBS domain containing-hemolysin-like protein
LWWLALAFGLLALQGAFVAAEVAFLATGVVKVRHLASEGGRAARILAWLLSDRSRLFSTVVVSITLLGYTAESLVTYLTTHYGDILGMPYLHYLGLGAVILVVVVLVEAFPVIAAIKSPERTSIALAPLAWLAYVVFWPLITALSLIANGILRVAGAVHQPSPSITEEEVISIIDEAEVQEDEKSMLLRVLDFGDRTVEEVMVPRTDMICVREDDSIHHTLGTMLESRHSRLPVFRERRDMIVGVVYNKDLLPFLIEGQSDRPVSEAMRPAHFVHEKRLVADLVREFQEHRRVMALVTDEFGGIAGLVTMEDALEELVGEILDEEDLEERSTQPLGDDTYLVRGNTATHDLERDLSISLPEGEYETVSGLVQSELGHIPDIDEAVELSSGVRIQVLEADARRVLSVKVILPPSDDGEGDAEAVEDEPH